jgi:hypothetical protein
MGQHKHNPTAIKAKNGELPPKPKTLSKRELEKMMYEKCQEMVYKPFVDAYTKIQKEESI